MQYTLNDSDRNQIDQALQAVQAQADGLAAPLPATLLASSHDTEWPPWLRLCHAALVCNRFMPADTEARRQLAADDAPITDRDLLHCVVHPAAPPASLKGLLVQRFAWRASGSHAAFGEPVRPDQRYQSLVQARHGDDEASGSVPGQGQLDQPEATATRSTSSASTRACAWCGFGCLIQNAEPRDLTPAVVLPAATCGGRPSQGEGCRPSRSALAADGLVHPPHGAVSAAAGAAFNLGRRPRLAWQTPVGALQCPQGHRRIQRRQCPRSLHRLTPAGGIARRQVE